MTGFWPQFRNGAWLTADRARAYSLILLALGTLAFIGWIALADGAVDRNGKPLGTDFSSFYAAGSMALEGKAAEVYNAAAHFGREQQIFGAHTPYYAWFYPPIFLLIAAPLALLPYPLALAVWQGLSLLFYLGVIGAVMRRSAMPDAVRRNWLPVALAFPAVFINLGHGQNGFLTTGLFGAALLALAHRPALAGVLFGLMAYKPQFALVIPLALLATLQWRSIAAAVATVVALIAITAAIFSIDCWTAFVATTDASRHLLLEQGEVGFAKLQSVFAAVRMWGGSVALAYLVQSIVSVAVICSAVWSWRVTCDANLRAAILLIATLLASPHVLDYDLMLLAPAIAFMVAAGIANGFRSYEITLLAAAWITPLLARSVAGASGVPLGLLVLLALYVAAIRRAALDRHGVSLSPEHIAAM
jgi:alpha-1,2-mannosyltransferase